MCCVVQGLLGVELSLISCTHRQQQQQQQQQQQMTAVSSCWKVGLRAANHNTAAADSSAAAQVVATQKPHGLLPQVVWLYLCVSGATRSGAVITPPTVVPG